VLAGGESSLSFTSNYEPQTFRSGETLFIWSATELAVIDIETGLRHDVTCSEPIHSVTVLDDSSIVVVCDTYVAIIDRAQWRERIVFDHDEILIEERWDGRRLLLTDLRGIRLRVEL
jgi:hypothetical protein